MDHLKISKCKLRNANYWNEQKKMHLKDKRKRW